MSAAGVPLPPAPSGAGRHPVLALAAARWRTLRPPAVRPLVAVPVALLLVAPVLSIWLGASLPRTYVAEAALLLPAGVTGLLVTSALSPLLVGGGFELVPESQLAAYPLRPRTRVDVSLLLTPLNLAWVVQTCALATATAYVAEGPLAPWLPGLLAVGLAGVLAVVGLLLSWLLLGWARTPRRRLVAAVVATVAVVVAVWRLREAALVDVAAAFGADRLAALLRVASDGWGAATIAVALLLATGLLAHEAAVRAAGWALRRPVVRLARDDDRPVRRRAPARTVDAELRAIDRAGVWRSVPLRRGVLVITLTPAVLTLLAPLDAVVLTLLPPLVATGAGLLFSVNSFALDGSGALWRASLPGLAERALRAKALVSAEVVGLPVVVTLGAATVRAEGPWTATAVLCILGSAVACTALVVTRGMRWSVVHPYRADLRGPRDTPAPPGMLALYSARLAIATSITGTAYGVCLQADSALGFVVVSAVVASVVAVSWVITRTRWSDPVVRSRVASVVAAG